MVVRALAQRIEIKSWRQEIAQVRGVFYCDHCGNQICGCYMRKVIRYVCENRRYGSSLMVQRDCGDCM